MIQIISRLVTAVSAVTAEVTAKSIPMATTIRNHFLRGEYC